MDPHVPRLKLFIVIAVLLCIYHQHIPPAYHQHTFYIPSTYLQHTFNIPSTYLQHSFNIPSRHHRHTLNASFSSNTWHLRVHLRTSTQPFTWLLKAIGREILVEVPKTLWWYTRHYTFCDDNVQPILCGLSYPGI